MSGTQEEAYARRLDHLGSVWWKRLLRPVDPYTRRLRRLELGTTLDVGCGLGRNLAHLAPGSVGVDHNPTAVAHCVARGLTAFTTDEFLSADYPEGAFDSVLVSHVLEHLTAQDAKEVLLNYLPFVRPGGRVFLITPQERGYASDSTHVHWTTGEDLEQLASDVGLRADRWRSFPLPRIAGRAFIYNEFTLLAHKPG